MLSPPITETPPRNPKPPPFCDPPESLSLSLSPLPPNVSSGLPPLNTTRPHSQFSSERKQSPLFDFPLIYLRWLLTKKKIGFFFNHYPSRQYFNRNSSVFLWVDIYKWNFVLSKMKLHFTVWIFIYGKFFSLSFWSIHTCRLFLFLFISFL